jgi:alanine-synthesizing transaminase
MPGVSCVPPSAAFYAMPKIDLPDDRTDEDYVLGLLRATGILCVYGSGFGLRPTDGFLRLVFLASPATLSTIFDEMAAFTREFLDPARSARAGVGR